MASLNWDTAAEYEFWRRKCLDSFWYFFRYAWGYDFNPKGAAGNKPWMDEATHKPVCDWFEFHAKEWLRARVEGKNLCKKLLCVVPRDFGKTTLLSQAGQAWLHLHDPELATYTGCETATRAREVLAGIKAVIGGDDPYARFAWLYGSQKGKNRKWKIDGAVTAARSNLTRRDDSYGIWAVESGLVGMHPDGCFFDDPNTYERMERHADWLDMVNRHLDTLIPVFRSDAIWVLTATRYGDGDHVGRTIKMEGVASCSGMHMPGLKIEKDGLWHLFFLDAEDERGEPTMPKIWDKVRIEGFKRRNPTRYYAQVRNNPTQSPYNILPMADAERLIISADDVPIKRLKVSIHFDTAFKNPRRKARGDYNVIAAAGHEKGTGRVHFLGAETSQTWNSEQFADRLISAVVEWRNKAADVSCMTDEEEIGGKPGVWPAFLQTKFRERGIRMPQLLIIARERHKRKDERLAEVAALWRDHKMCLPRGAPGLDMLLDQMTKIGMSEYDDLADAMADAFHKDVYSVLWPKNTSIYTKNEMNPFDDVLKPGLAGDMAAERIAESYARAEAQQPNTFGVIRP